MQELLGLVVIGQQLVAERPSQALVIGVGLELVRREAQEGGTVPLRLAADIVVFAGTNCWPLLSYQSSLFLNLPLLNTSRVESVLPSRGRALPFSSIRTERPRSGQPVGRGSTAGAGADHDDVVHGSSFSW